MACLALGLAPGALPAQSEPLQVQVRGTLLLNGFRNSARVNNADVPTVVLPPEDDDFPVGGGNR